MIDRFYRCGMTLMMLIQTALLAYLVWIERSK